MNSTLVILGGIPIYLLVWFAYWISVRKINKKRKTPHSSIFTATASLVIVGLGIVSLIHASEIGSEHQHYGNYIALGTLLTSLFIGTFIQIVSSIDSAVVADEFKNELNRLQSIEELLQKLVIEQKIQSEKISNMTSAVNKKKSPSYDLSVLEEISGKSNSKSKRINKKKSKPKK